MGWLKKFLGDTGVEQHGETPEPEQKPRSTRRNFRKVYPLHAEITVLCEGNPKRPGTLAHKNFNHYGVCETVSDCLELGITYRQLDYDVQNDFISVGSHV